jgi:hypothetical protein
MNVHQTNTVQNPGGQKLSDCRKQVIFHFLFHGNTKEKQDF